MQISRNSPSSLYRTLLLALLACALICLQGCNACSDTAPLAELLKKSGDVKRDTRQSQEAWTDASIGAEFQIGDAVRTSPNAGAELALDDGSLLGLEESTLVRFLERRPGEKRQSLDLEVGAASLEAPSGGTSIRTSFGLARLEGGTRVRLRRSEDRMRYEVLLGSAQLEALDGSVRTAKAGESIEISLGQATLETSTEQKAAPPEPSEDPEADALDPFEIDSQGTSIFVRAKGSQDERELPKGKSVLEPGSQIELRPGSRATVSQGSSAAELANPGKYTIGGGQLITAESGAVTIRTESTVRIRVPGGIIETTRGSATIESKSGSSTVTQAAGTSALIGKSREKLYVGESGSISQGGEVKVPGRGLDRADLEMKVGSSLVIHDPAPPTAVKFLFAQECENGLIRLKGMKKAIPGDKSARGDNEVSLALGPGSVRYTLHCIDEKGKESSAVKSGQVSIIADAGHRPMPSKAPSTSVDLNGLGYTVLYQNQLPQVTMRWSKAPAVGPFQLHLTSNGRSKTYSAKGPSYSFGSGALAPGQHTAHFTGGGRVSRKTTVSIRFDNATPTASLSTPANTGTPPGGAITISGTALPGWTATVDGKAVDQDAGGKFTVKTTMPSSGYALQVALTHKSRGSHVYLRRPAGSP